jgi:hypothetical protein
MEKAAGLFETPGFLYRLGARTLKFLTLLLSYIACFVEYLSRDIKFARVAQACAKGALKPRSNRVEFAPANRSRLQLPRSTLQFEPLSPTALRL